MEKIIHQKCPECGQWCTAKHNGIIRGFINRFKKGAEDTFEDSVVALVDIGKSLSFGNEKVAKITEGVGAFAGGAVGTYLSASGGLVNAFTGKKFQFVCPRCNSKWETDDETENYFEYRRQEEKVDEYRQQFKEITPKQLDRYITELQQTLKSKYNSDVSLAIINDILGASYYKLGSKENALKFINDSLSVYDDSQTHALKGLIIGMGGNLSISDQYDAMCELVRYKDIDVDVTDFFYFSKAELDEQMRKYEQNYSRNFSSLPVAKRHFVYVANELIAMPKSFAVLTIDNLPEDIHFIDGTPHLNTLYTLHPYKHNLYIPVDSYSVEIFRDQVEEFIHIMDCMGAKRIDFSDSHDQRNEQSRENGMKIKGGGSYESIEDNYSGGFGYDKEQERECARTLSNYLKKGKEYQLSSTTKPYIPDDLVWYPHQQSWQRDCKSRMEGRLINADYEITVSTDQMGSKAQKMNIEAEVSALQVKLNGGYESKEKFRFKDSATHKWKCEVEFYPLSDYETRLNVSALNVSAEQAYLEELRIYISDDGKIDAKERASLERTRKNLGLSIERAAELEKQLLIVSPTKRIPTWLIAVGSAVVAAAAAIGTMFLII